MSTAKPLPGELWYIAIGHKSWVATVEATVEDEAIITLREGSGHHFLVPFSIFITRISAAEPPRKSLIHRYLATVRKWLGL